MFPIALDLTRIPVLLTGSGELLRKRLAYLDEAQASKVVVFCQQPSEEVKQAAGKRLVEKLPTATDMRDYQIILIAGLERRQAEILANAARALGKLVNVEDVNDLCDFYFTANVRRGDLLIAVSTGGASPTLARKVRDAIAQHFGEEWDARVREIGRLRQGWKAAGLGFQEVLERTERFLVDKGWLA